MRWLACVVACAGCDALFRIDAVMVVDASASRDDGRSSDGRDAVIDAPADGALSFCAMQPPTPLLCADFDTGMTDFGQFGSETSIGGTLGDTTTAAASPPSSLRAFTPGSSNPVKLLVSRSFATTVASIDFAFDVPSMADECGQNIARVTWTGATVTAAVSSGMVVVTGTGASCSVGQIANSAYTFGAWNQLSIDVTPSSIGLSLHNTEIGSLACTAVGNPTLELGLETTTAVGTCTTLVDNVVVR